MPNQSTLRLNPHRHHPVLLLAVYAFVVDLYVRCTLVRVVTRVARGCLRCVTDLQVLDLRS